MGEYRVDQLDRLFIRGLHGMVVSGDIVGMEDKMGRWEFSFVGSACVYWGGSKSTTSHQEGDAL